MCVEIRIFIGERQRLAHYSLEIGYAHASRAWHEQFREGFRLDDSLGMSEWLAGIFCDYASHHR